MAIKISNNTIIDDSRVIINASKVGIGTTNPSNELHVIGNARITDSLGVGHTASLSSGDIRVTSINNGPLAGFRNKIINGNFLVNDYGIPSENMNNSYGFVINRWIIGFTTSNTVGIATRMDFAIGQTEVPGNPKHYMRLDVTNTQDSLGFFWQGIEDVTLFSGETATFSFYAKANPAITLLRVLCAQRFGDGGSADNNNFGFNNVGIGTLWARYTFTDTFASVSGKTIGSSGVPNIRCILDLPNASSTYTLDLANFQLERGPIATPFEERDIQSEISRCRRYYHTSFPEGTLHGNNAGLDGAIVFPQSAGGSADNEVPLFNFPVQMVFAPSITLYNPSANNSEIRNISLNADWASTTVSGINKNGARIDGYTSGGSDEGNACAYHYTANAEF